MSYIIRCWVCLAVLCSVLYFTWAEKEKVMIHVPSAVVMRLKEQAQVCSKANGVPVETVRSMMEWTIPNETKYKSFLYCLLYNTGFHEVDGHFNIDHMMALEPKSETREDFANNLKECNKSIFDNPLDTVYEMCACFFTKFVIKR